MKASLRCLLLVLVIAVAPAAAVLAHQDRIIELQGDRLVGLPRRYEPAILDLKSFRIGTRGQRKEFSPFLKNLFRQPHDLRLSASWYHHASTLPPYLLLRITPRGEEHSHQILIDIEALRLIYVERVVRESNGATRHQRIPLSSLDISKAAGVAR